MLVSKKLCSVRIAAPILFFSLLAATRPAVASPIYWTLSNVEFNDGLTATGSFIYDADTNTVSNISIVEGGTSFTALETFFPVHPFEIVIVPNVPLTFGAKLPAIVFLPSPQLTNAGGTVELFGVNGISMDGVACADACDGVTTHSQISSGELIGSAVPEPAYSAPLVLALALFALTLHRKSEQTAACSTSPSKNDL